MKGVILVGGHGTRLRPVTLATNKHLLPLYDKPVIYHAIEKMVSAGIDRIMIVSAPNHIDDFVRLLGSGEHWISQRTGKQIQIVYAIQNEASGIAEGLWIAKEYVGEDNCMLYLGDNIVEDDLTPYVQSFESGATVFLKEVSDPERFGVAYLDENDCITEIVEKPQNPKSNLAVTGVYLYDNTVFEKMIDQPVSDRGEYEITYINDLYCKEGTLKGVYLKESWFDIGTFDSLLDASAYMRLKKD